MLALEVEAEERSEHHARGQEHYRHGNILDAGDVLLEGPTETPGEPTDPHAVEDVQPGNGPEADGAADEPDVKNRAEEEWEVRPAQHPRPDGSQKHNCGDLEQDVAQRDEANDDSHGPLPCGALLLPQHHPQVESVGEDSQDEQQGDSTQLQMVWFKHGCRLFQLWGKRRFHGTSEGN